MEAKKNGTRMNAVQADQRGFRQETDLRKSATSAFIRVLF
jgi:hypothetical protein